MNARYMNIAFTDAPHQVGSSPTHKTEIYVELTHEQCNEEDGTCAEMERELVWAQRVTPAEAAKNKCELQLLPSGR